jgi:Na+-transporting NADH:ubiquinone oxidoreductase subunit NqrF
MACGNNQSFISDKLKSINQIEGNVLNPTTTSQFIHTVVTSEILPLTSVPDGTIIYNCSKRLNKTNMIKCNINLKEEESNIIFM